MTIDQVNGEVATPTVGGVEDELLPVSLLCGFLGAGKTTLMKHILETKHAEEGFKCAVIVNDMATLNIDKSLIDQSALVQTDEVIAMQNGCFCCTLQNDLVEQITGLAQKKMFDYMLIEASGVSEPSQIAPLFEPCEDDHDGADHEEAHITGPQLSDLARLDTCITVVDAAEFHCNLDSMKLFEEGETQGTIAELMTEQVEYSNVVILNKQDLVSEEQQLDILDRIHLLNPRAKVIRSQQSRVDVRELLNTKLYKREEMEECSIMLGATKVEAKDLQIEPEKEPDCCIISVESGKMKCCKPKNERIIDSGLSQILLGVVPTDSNNKIVNAPKTRHEERFGISSFIYRARRPFHPGRLYEDFLDPNFMVLLDDPDDDESDSDEEEGEETKEKSDKKASQAVYADSPKPKQSVQPAEGLVEPGYLFVDNLAEKVSAKGIYKFFEKNGIDVMEIRMHRKKPNAFVDVVSAAEAQKALALNGTDLKGNPIEIKIIEKIDPKDLNEEPTEEELKQQAEDLAKQQETAMKKKRNRVRMMGELLRSKGFVWVASAHDVMAGWQQAGNIIRIEAEGPWMCNVPEMWTDTPSEELVMKDMKKENGDKYEFSDRRQELVFIGCRLSHKTIQDCLDCCLLTDEEMELGAEAWEEEFGDEDRLGLALELDDEDGWETESEEEMEEGDDKPQV